jgi:RNA-directed DNA polymerase
MELSVGHTEDAMESADVSTKQRQIAELARIHPEVSFTSLAYHIDLRWLHEAYQRTRKDAAVGVDGQTAEEYAKDLGSNLKGLLERAKSGKYFAPPVRRVHIPKGTGSETRPIGIPTFEDKVLQRAVQMVLEPLYEQEFLDCSYGFRPGKSAHGALDALWEGLMQMGGGWIIDLDIRKFFDTLDKNHLREILKRRVCDGVLLRLIGKWLNAGVLEGGEISYPERGTPQGGVISPMLSNIYLHEVLDRWFVAEVKPRLKGEAFMIRFADDAVLVFAQKEDAERVMDVLPKRFGKYGLTIHPEKTRLICFGKPPKSEDDGTPKPPRWDKFGFLGFTHYWGKSLKGLWVVKRKTEASRLIRALKKVMEWCRRNRHRPLGDQRRILAQKLNGHYAYYGITGNARSLCVFYRRVKAIWRKWLMRRSRGQYISMERFEEILQRYPLPTARVVHSCM